MTASPVFMRKLLIVLLPAIMVLSGCASAAITPSATTPETTSVATTAATSTTPAPGQSLRGVSLSPKSMNALDFSSFVKKAAASLDVVTWAGDWLELTRPDDGGPTVIATLGKEYGFLPLTELSFHHDGDLVRPLDAGNRQLFLSSVANYASMWKPAYLGIGIEMNTLYEKHPDDFEAFVSLFNEAVPAIKAVSPDTKVFTCFQLEKMKGYTLWQNDPPDPSSAEWDLIDRFNADLVAFTTYPDLVFKDPSEIPDDYYTSIAGHVDKPVIFTEIGWHAAASPAGWESSDEEQAAFVTRFLTLVAPLKSPMLIWSFMYDQAVQAPFDTMGLYTSVGPARPAAALGLGFYAGLFLAPTRGVLREWPEAPHVFLRKTRFSVAGRLPR